MVKFNPPRGNADACDVESFVPGRPNQRGNLPVQTVSGYATGRSFVYLLPTSLSEQPIYSPNLGASANPFGRVYNPNSAHHGLPGGSPRFSADATRQV